MKILATSALLLLLAACAPSLPAGEMMPMTQVYDQIPANKELERKVKIGSVTVFENAGGMTAPVQPEIYKEAIQNALLTSNMAVRAGDDPSYTLDARLTDLDVPMFGFSMTATATANYKLTLVSSGAVVADETVKLPYTATFGESFDGNQRARLATARAIRENITHMIRVLSAKSASELHGGDKS